MGYKQDQSFPSEYEYQRPEDLAGDVPPSYSETVNGNNGYEALDTRDPRSTSTESLIPEVNNQKRTLLLIYIHGFMGNETSFQSFPAHVHNLACSLLSESHVVHTKIYPRYKSRKVIEFARNDFSNWLRPHESYKTDVILLGHSMGGILGAEVAIMPANPPSSEHPFQHKILGTINFDTPFLGMHPGIVFAGIGSLFRPAPEVPKAKQQASNVESPGSPPLSSVPSNTQSLLNVPEHVQPPAAQGIDGTASSSASISSTQLGLQRTPSPLASPISDPNFNPQYTNDAPVPVRQGWDKAFNFFMKHSGHLTTAAKTYVTSHWEFGGAMADYNGLRSRYAVLRLLEDGKDINGKATRIIRLVNYYTASTGRPPKIKASISDGSKSPVNAVVCQNIPEDEPSNLENGSLDRSSTRRGSSPDVWEQQMVHSPASNNLEEATDETRVRNTCLDDDDDLYGDGAGQENLTTLTDGESQIETDPEVGTNVLSTTTNMPVDTLSRTTSISGTSIASSLPPLGPLPQPPADLDLDSITDKDERKLAVKEYSRQMQAYQRTMKDREKAVKERRKLLEKREKALEKDRVKQLKQEEKERAKANREKVKPKTSSTPKALLDQAAKTKTEEALTKKPEPAQRAKASEEPMSDVVKPMEASEPTTEKPKKDRKFCMLPPKDSRGQVDRCWPRVFMEGVDEVGAHCGLFVAESPHYEGLVYNVGNRIKEWVVEARALHEERLLATQDFASRRREKG